MSLKEIVGINLRYYRYQSGQSQDEYYISHGLSPKYLACLERGEKNFKIETIEDIASKLGITPDDLLIYDKSRKINKKRIDEKEKVSS